MQIQNTIPVQVSSVSVAQAASAPAASQDIFQRAPVTQFCAGSDGVQFLAQVSQAFEAGVQRIRDTAARQPTTADLTAAKVWSRCNTKRSVDIGTLGLMHAVRKIRRAWQDGRLAQVATGAGMVTLSLTGMAALTASCIGFALMFSASMGVVDFRERSQAGTLKFLISREVYRFADKLWRLTKDIDDSFVTGEVSPALCLEVVASLRNQLPDLRQQLAQHAEPRVARSRRLPRQLDAVGGLLDRIEGQAQRRLRLTVDSGALPICKANCSGALSKN